MMDSIHVNDQQEPLTFIIICVKHDKKGLRKTLHSLEGLNDSFAIIIVGASEDDFPDREIHHKFAFISDGGSGIYSAMNLALSLISNPKSFVFFLNAGDTLVSVSSLTEVVEELKDSNTYWAISNCYVYSGEDYLRTSSENFSRLNSMTWGKRGFLQQATVIQKCAYEIVGQFDENYLVAADLDFFCRLAAFSKPLELRIPLTNYFLGGYSSKMRHKTCYELHQIRSKYNRSSKSKVYNFVSYAFYLFVLGPSMAFGYLDRKFPTFANSLRRLSLLRTQ